MKISKRIMSCLIVALLAGAGCVDRGVIKKSGSEAGKLIQDEVITGTPAAKAWIEPITGMEFVRIRGGCFQMGNPEYLEVEGENEGPVHEVCLDDFYMGRYEVTVGEFSRFSEATGYLNEVSDLDVCYVVTGVGWKRYQRKNWRSHNFSQGKNEPAVCLNWYDAQAFAKWLSSQEGGRSYRLPTEAEWEYAARAGSNSTRYWGDNIDDTCGYANVHDQTSKRDNKFTWTEHNCDDGYARTAPVGSFKANKFGLYDMLGNVWEWGQDWYAKDYYAGQDSRNNPAGPPSGQYRTMRGGAWANEPEQVRAAYRVFDLPDNRYDYTGFRLVFSPDGGNTGSRIKESSAQ